MEDNYLHTTNEDKALEWWMNEWAECNRLRHKYKMALSNIQNILQDSIENTVPVQLTIDIGKIVKEALK